ncbi:DUF6197 family protein [Actinoplanes aureus]|uniref:Uncharacterized protein n=1 Tax=Actinoplanes aureus TaxID=2792083 RepID=A0A931G316_9ACTN|nr:hypothetical protein [Actinoplanes aureus]MBG0566611.1 hypothetical protein [Actinoplanes aureus]
MTPTIEEPLTTARGAPARRRSLLDRIRAFQQPEPRTPPWQGRPEEAYHVLEGARAVIARGWIQDDWFARRPSDGPGDVAAACLVGAVVYAAQQSGSGDPAVKAGPALDYLWDAWQESRGLGGTGVAGLAAPRELRMARVRDLTRWNDQPCRTREEVLDLVDLATSRAVMAAVSGSR